MMRHKTLVCFFAITATAMISNANLLNATTVTLQPQDSYVSYLDTDSGSGEILTPGQKLEQCVELAKSGEVDQAFDNVRAARDIGSADGLYPVLYIQALAKIFRHAEGDSQLPILKEAVRAVNDLKVQESYRGRENPETAYHFMIALGELAELTLPINEPASCKLRLCQGRIARNLDLNPGFPADAKQSLASSLIAMAQAHAVEGEQKLALVAIKDAYEFGFSEFDQLRSDELLARMSDQKTFRSYLDQLEDAYLIKVKKWSKQAIAEFQPFQFEFHVDSVEGGSFNNDSFDDQVLVVDFWATWCPPCRKGIPHFIELQNELGPEGVQVVGISMDSPEDPESSVETVRDFMDENSFTYPCGMGTNDLSERIPGDMKLPTTLFLDRLGNVRYIANGYHDFTQLAAIAETLAEEEQHVRVSNAR